MACVFASKLIVSRAEPDTRSLRGASPLSRRASAPKASAAAGFSRPPSLESLVLLELSATVPPLPFLRKPWLWLRQASLPAQRLKGAGAE